MCGFVAYVSAVDLTSKHSGRLAESGISRTFANSTATRHAKVHHRVSLIISLVNEFDMVSPYRQYDQLCVL